MFFYEEPFAGALGNIYMYIYIYILKTVYIYILYMYNYICTCVCAVCVCVYTCYMLHCLPLPRRKHCMWKSSIWYCAPVMTSKLVRQTWPRCWSACPRLPTTVHVHVELVQVVAFQGQHVSQNQPFLAAPCLCTAQSAFGPQTSIL